MPGVDLTNQFPNSVMAKAVKLGHSRMVASDVPSIAVGDQLQVDVTTVKTLTVPSTTGANASSATYAVVTAIGGSLYYTVDGTTPSASNYAGVVAAGAAVPFYGLQFLQALKFFGTTMSVAYSQ
jgi:hypothetical protein